MSAIVDVVVKIGGGALQTPDALRAVLAGLDPMRERMLIVPGGGPFADAVRQIDRRLTLPPTTAHWMAIVAMDQYAELLVSQMPRAVRVETPNEIALALTSRHLPVLAPSRWLREADPLPHTWEVTSDSIAAWVSGAVGARRLMLIKPAGATGQLVDDYFERALPPSVTVTMLRVDECAHTLSATP